MAEKEAAAIGLMLPTLFQCRSHDIVFRLRTCRIAPGSISSPHTLSILRTAGDLLHFSLSPCQTSDELHHLVW